MGHLPSSPYLGSEHVCQAIGGSMEREAPDQVDDEHTVRQQRREVYHLWAPEHTVSSQQERVLWGPQAQAGRPAIPKEHCGTISAVWATGSWGGIVVLGQTRVLSLGNWVVDMDVAPRKSLVQGRRENRSWNPLSSSLPSTQPYSRKDSRSPTGIHHEISI